MSTTAQIESFSSFEMSTQLLSAKVARFRTLFLIHSSH